MFLCVTLGSSHLSQEISPEYSLEGLMLKPKLQYFDHLKWRTDSLEKTLLLGKIEGRKRRELQRMIWLDGITNSMDRETWHAAIYGVTRVGHSWATELTNWHLSQVFRIHRIAMVWKKDSIFKESYGWWRGKDFFSLIRFRSSISRLTWLWKSFYLEVLLLLQLLMF